MENKKAWERPKLIVLMRSRLEESVLVVCKTNLAPGGAPSSATGCITYATGCFACNAISGS